MEEKINIAEILRNKPHGVKLYSPIFGNCTYCYIHGETSDICVKRPYNVMSYFNFEGLYNTAGECLLFPSKEMRNWSKFAWKKGDVLVSDNGKVEVIFEKFVNDTYQSFIGKHHLDNLEDNLYYQNEGEYLTSIFNTESKDAAQTYVKTLEKKLGGKLNHETLEVEKTQPEFKDGDIAFADYGNRKDVFIVSDKTNLLECYNSFISLDLSGLTLNMGYRTSYFKSNICKLRIATEEEKQQLFDALAKEGKAWDAKKKQIVDLKPKCKFKPFDKVLVRDNEDDIWEVSLFGYKDDELYYRCDNGITWIQCIPYDGNEHLLGTTNNVEG